MEKTNYKFVNLEELTKLTNFDQIIMFDLETIGLYGRIRLAQFYQPEFKDIVYIVEYPDPMQLVSYLSKLHFVGHNIHYDISTIQEQLGKISWVPENFDCTFLLSRLYFYTQEKFDLGNVVKYALGFDPYEGDKKDLQGSDWSIPVLSEDQLSYAATDVLYLWQVYEKVKEQKEDINYTLDILATKYCLDFQNNGLPFNEDKLNAQFERNMKRIQEIGLTINCNSYQQVRAYIDSDKSDDAGLAVLISQGNKKAEEVRETRKLTKNNSFLTKFLNESSDGKIFGKFKMSARSGRSTSNDQNLQQLPRSTKGIFGTTKESGSILIYSDFAQIQLRAVCVVTGDTTMENIFREGGDLHNYVAKMIFGDNFTKDQRQISKTANFGLLFGAGVEVFRSILLKEAGLALSEKEAMEIKKKWLSLWKQISEWQTDGIKAWKKKLAWETPLGRRYTAKMMTDQLAMQIQGFEAEVAKLAMHYMLPKIKEISSEVKLANFVHDSYVFTSPDEPKIYKQVCEAIADCMQEAWKEMSGSVKIQDLPMPTNVRVGYNWGDIENDIFIYEINK